MDLNKFVHKHVKPCTLHWPNSPTVHWPYRQEQGDEAGERVRHSRHGGWQVIGVVPVWQAWVRLHRGKHHVGQGVHPGQNHKDINHLHPAVRASAKAASLLVCRPVRIHHERLLGPLPVFLRFLLHPVGVSAAGMLPGHRRVVVQQQERHQTHHHHGAEEEEEHLSWEVGWLILGLEVKGCRDVGGV